MPEEPRRTPIVVKLTTSTLVTAIISLDTYKMLLRCIWEAKL